MTKRKTRARAKARTKPPPLTADTPTIARALKDLGINKPYYTARVVGSRIELQLYGGEVVYWPGEGGAA